MTSDKIRKRELVLRRLKQIRKSKANDDSNDPNYTGWLEGYEDALMYVLYLPQPRKGANTRDK